MRNTDDGGTSFACVQDDGPDRPKRGGGSENSENPPAYTDEKFKVPGVALIDKDEKTTFTVGARRTARETADLHDHEKRDGDGKTVSSPQLLTLIVDNYDSFTYSIFQYFSSVNGIPPLVVKNDEFPSWEALKKCLPNIDNIVISPGPGHPGNAEDFGVSSSALQEAAVPTLGICLGHQGFAHVYGGKVSRAPTPVHGRRSVVEFLQDYDLFRGIEQGTTVLRYHSLVVERANLPACLEVTCWTRDEQRLIMGLRHTKLPLHGVQFHPESIGTAEGFRMLQNFTHMSLAWWRENGKNAAACTGLEEADALSRRLLRESRITAVGTESRRTGPGGGGGKETAGKGDEAIGGGEAATARGSEAAPEGRAPQERKGAAKAGGAANARTDGNLVTTGSPGWVVNVAVVPRARENSRWGSEEHQQQQSKVEGNGSDGNTKCVYDQAAIFEKLFAKENVCFWLDSSSADESCAGIHTCKHYSQRACVSYMGGCSGPFAEALEYYEKEKKAVLRSFTQGNTTTVTLEHANLFQLLATRLQRFSPAAELNGSSHRSCGGTGRENHSNNSNSTPKGSKWRETSSTFPSSSSSGCVGSCSSRSASNTSRTFTSSHSNSVEVRWWEMRDGTLQEVGDGGSLCCSSVLPVSPVATPQKEKLQDSAAALIPEDAAFRKKRPGTSRFPSSHAWPPFSFVGGYVGFFGYELRHLTEAYARLCTPLVGISAAVEPAAAAAAGKWRNGRMKCVTGAAAAAARHTETLKFDSDDRKCVKKPSAERAEDWTSRVRGTSRLQQRNMEGAAAAGESAAEAGVTEGGQPVEGARKEHLNEEEEAGNDGEERQQQGKSQAGQEKSIRREKSACDAVWVFADRVVAFELETNTAYLLWLTLATHATPSSPAAGDKETEDIAEDEQGRRTLRQLHEKEEQRSASAGPLVPASAAAVEEVCACAAFSPSQTTASSISPLAPSFPLNLSSCDSPASPVTKNVAVKAAAEPTAEEEGKIKVLPGAPESQASPKEEEAQLCDSVKRVQLAWAMQTVQQLLCLTSNSRTASAGAAPRTSLNAGGGDGDGNRDGETEARREDERKKGATILGDTYEANGGDAVTKAVDGTANGSGESRIAGAEEGTEAKNAAPGGNEKSEEGGLGRQEVGEEDANTQKKRKTTEIHGAKEEGGKECAEAAARSSEEEKRREEEERGKKGEIEQSTTVESEAEAEASTTGWRCAGLADALEKAAPSISSLPLASSTSTCCTPSASSSLILQQQERDTWLLQPRDTKAQYLEKIKNIFRFIASGDAYEVCLTTEFSGRLALQTEDIFQFYCFLRKRNPTPFSVFFRYQPVERSWGSNISSSIPTTCEFTGRTVSNVQEEIPATAAVAAEDAAASFFPATALDPLRPAAVPACSRAATTTCAVAVGGGSAGAAAAAPCSFTICCASPELFLQVDKEGWLESRPIKGTRPRGSTAPADAALALELATSEKDTAENIMVVDVARSDLGRVSVPGSVHVPELTVVESYSHVHQLISTVRGKLRPELSFFDAVVAAFPGASMTGAPKKRVMELLHELEQRDRGVYSGAIGFLSVDRQAALNIPIRTLVFRDDQESRTVDSGSQKKVVEASFGTGGAILAGSDPDDEVEEMYLKADSVLSLFHEFVSSLNMHCAPDSRPAS